MTQVQSTKRKNPKVTCSIKAISDLIGAYDDTAVHSLAGASMDGKSTLTMAMCYDYSHQTGRNACIYDTEGGAQIFIDKWDKRLKERYPKAKTPLVYMQRSYKRIFKDHGRLVDISISDKGKMSPVMKGTIEEGIRYKDVDEKIKKVEASAFVKYIRDHDIGFVVYDSFTTPFATEIPPTTENFPCRNYFQMLLFRCIIDLIIDKEGCYVWALHHMSKNPQKPQNEPDMTGGKAVRHMSKVIIHMKKFEASGIKTYRILKLVRFYDKSIDQDDGKNKNSTYVKLTDAGYIDATEGQMDTAKKVAFDTRKVAKK